MDPVDPCVLGGSWTPAPGLVTVPRYLVVEDCGEMINPAVVEGQIRAE